MPIPAPPSSIAEHFHAGLDEGDNASSAALAFLYLHGLGVPRDEELALRLLGAQDMGKGACHSSRFRVVVGSEVAADQTASPAVRHPLQTARWPRASPPPSTPSPSCTATVSAASASTTRLRHSSSRR